MGRDLSRREALRQFDRETGLHHQSLGAFLRVSIVNVGWLNERPNGGGKRG